MTCMWGYLCSKRGKVSGTAGCVVSRSMAVVTSEWVVSWENNGSWHRKGSSVLKAAVGEGCSFSFAALGSPGSCWNFTRGVFGLRRLMEELLAIRGHYTLLSKALASSLVCPVGSHSPALLSPLVYHDR